MTARSEIPKPIPKPNPKPRKRRRGGDLAKIKTIEGTGDINDNGHEIVKDKDDAYTSLSLPGMKKQRDMQKDNSRWILPNQGPVEVQNGMVHDRRESDKGEISPWIVHGSLVLEFPTKVRFSI